VKKATVLAAFGLGLALDCGLVHGENSSRFTVSATILATNACHFTPDAPPAGAAAPRYFGCSGPGSFKNRHMRVTRVSGTAANVASGRYAGTVLLTLEP
jgi:hypothetical protein